VAAAFVCGIIVAAFIGFARALIQWLLLTYKQHGHHPALQLALLGLLGAELLAVLFAVVPPFQALAPWTAGLGAAAFLLAVLVASAIVDVAVLGHDGNDLESVLDPDWHSDD